MNVRIMYALKQMMKEISFTRKNYKLTATKRMNVSATDNHGLEGRERIYKMADIGGGLP